MQTPPEAGGGLPGQRRRLLLKFLEKLSDVQAVHQAVVGQQGQGHPEAAVSSSRRPKVIRGLLSAGQGTGWTTAV